MRNKCVVDKSMRTASSSLTKQGRSALGKLVKQIVLLCSIFYLIFTMWWIGLSLTSKWVYLRTWILCRPINSTAYKSVESMRIPRMMYSVWTMWRHDEAIRRRHHARGTGTVFCPALLTKMIARNCSKKDLGQEGSKSRERKGSGLRPSVEKKHLLCTTFLWLEALNKYRSQSRQTMRR